jgi:hypothetical protein
VIEYSLQRSLVRAVGVIVAAALVRAIWMHFVPVQPISAFPEQQEAARAFLARQFETMSWVTVTHYAWHAAALLALGCLTAILDLVRIRRASRLTGFAA